jgi:hypothetical protein
LSSLEDAKRHAKTNLETQVQLAQALKLLTESESKNFQDWYQPLFEETALKMSIIKNSKKQ